MHNEVSSLCIPPSNAPSLLCFISWFWEHFQKNIALRRIMTATLGRVDASQRAGFEGQHSVDFCLFVFKNPFIYPVQWVGIAWTLQSWGLRGLVVPTLHLPRRPAAWWPLQNAQWLGQKRFPRAWWTGYNEQTVCERASPRTHSLHILRHHTERGVREAERMLAGGEVPGASIREGRCRTPASPSTAAPAPPGHATPLHHRDEKSNTGISGLVR